MLTFVKPLVEPPVEDISEVKDQRSLQIALTLEAIWQLRNQVVHVGVQIQLLPVIKMLEHRYLEFLQLNYCEKVEKAAELCVWQSPSPGYFKCNLDEAITKDNAWIAVIARNDKGNILPGLGNLIYQKN